ncbi:PAAR-like domain-containing protein [Rhizobium sophoriradicis]|uniref:PAAR-like domain-containing protein n=1 Tax=Rhizobium sophoriradicis TaxID=1535245 RepID=UPI0014821F78|nr:PAAR-like domain-containing protein [Rhizobium sophoriradicis]
MSQIIQAPEDRQSREGLRDLDDARIVSLSPDVCLTPVGSSGVPIPYTIVDYCGHDKDYTPSVLFTGKAMVMPGAGSRS